jgi:hypothetical protein
VFYYSELLLRGDIAINMPRPDVLQWDLNVPMLTNRYMLAALAKIMLGSGGIVAALVSLLFGFQGEWQLIPGIAALLFCISLGLFVMGLVVMIFPFKNRLASRFTIDPDGVHLAVTDSTARTGNRLAFLMGLVLGSGSTAGSGLLAMTQESQILRWGGAFRAVAEPATCSIAFRNGWRTLLRVYCLPDNFNLVVDRVNREMALHGTASRVSRRSPLGAYLVRTVLVIVACLPILAVSELFDFSLLLPFVLLCFGVAMVWFLRPLAWVVLVMLAVISLLVLAGLWEDRTSYIDSSHYLRYQVLSGDSWALIVLAALGAATLIWLAVATLKARIRPAFEQDLIDGGGDE